MTLNEYQIKWIAALKSGKYEKNRIGYLKIVDGDKESFCCLGVACEINKELLSVNHNEGEVGDFSSAVLFDKHSADLPLKIEQLLGMKNHLGNMDVKDSKLFYEALKGFGYTGRMCHTIVLYNDMTDATFEQLGKTIEAVPETLFDKRRSG